MSLLQLNQEKSLELSTQRLTEENSIILQLLEKMWEGIIYRGVNRVALCTFQDDTLVFRSCDLAWNSAHIKLTT